MSKKGNEQNISETKHIQWFLIKNKKKNNQNCLLHLKYHLFYLFSQLSVVIYLNLASFDTISHIFYYFSNFPFSSAYIYITTSAAIHSSLITCSNHQFILFCLIHYWLLLLSNLLLTYSFSPHSPLIHLSTHFCYTNTLLYFLVHCPTFYIIKHCSFFLFKKNHFITQNTDVIINIH